jgi:hypothetical protein
VHAAGVSSCRCHGVLAASIVALGGCILPFVGSMPTPGLKVAFLVVGAAIGSSIFVVMPMIVSEPTPQLQRAATLTITFAIITLAGVIAPLAIGAVIQNASSPLAGYEQSYVILGGLLLAGGIIGLVWRLSAGWAMCRRSDALLRLPSLATWIRVRSWESSIERYNTGISDHGE